MIFLPWYNNEVISFLESFLTKDITVFEYGGGHSTIFYSSKAHSVYTIETRKEWFDFILKHQAVKNIELKLCTNLVKFAEEIENFTLKNFDLIVIDSRDRANCCIKAIDHIKEGGKIILDNSERSNLTQCKNTMQNMGFKEQVLTGTRSDGMTSTTSIFSKF